MIPIRSVVYELYRRGKGRIAYLLDRLIDLCDMVLMDAYRFPWSAAQNIAQSIARYIGDASWLLHDFPRLSAYELKGTNWTIIFVGRDAGLKEIRHLFFQEEVDQQELGRIASWKLSAQTQQWLAAGVDLVLCELSRIHPQPPRTTLTFTVPTWIQQTLTIPESLEALISGSRFRTVRRNLNRARRAEFNYRFSQSKEDLDHFYYQMYLPYVKARHRDLALVAPYQDQWKKWFVRGGLVLVTHHNTPVGGVLCYVANGVCFATDTGVLWASPQLLEQQITTIINWYAIIWGRDQGANIFDMGGTRPWRSNGVFINKRRWGARVIRRKRIYGVWTFLAQNLCPSLQDRINELGFISEVDGRFYSVLLGTETTPITETDANKELLAIKNQGLDGLVVISANSRPIVYNCP